MTLSKRYLSLFVLLLQAILLTAQSTPSPHFTIQKLDEGVWAAIATPGGMAMCNAGIIDLGDETLIFDSFMSPAAARDLRESATELTGHPAKYLVNSHYHHDHIAGNQVFDGATIISTTRTKELIEKNQPGEIEFAKTGAADYVKREKAVSAAGMSAFELQERVMWIAYFDAYALSADELRIALPTLLVEDELTIPGSKQNAQLLSFGKGHTESDLFLYLPEKKILFSGDLLFINHQPWMREGFIDPWISNLDSIKKMDTKMIVPGHGPVGSKADIDILIRYFENVRETALKYKQKGISPEMNSYLAAPPPFENWHLTRFYKPNVVSEYKKM